MKLGIRDTVLHGAVDRALDVARNLGFDGIEMTLGGPHLREHPIWSRAGVRVLETYLQDSRSHIASIYLQRFETFGLTHAEESVRENARKLLHALIPRAGEVRAEVLRIPIEIRNTSADNSLISVLKDFGTLAQSHNLTLVLDLDTPPEPAHSFILSVGHENVGLDFDVGRSVLSGRHPVEDVGILGAGIFQIHIRDVDESLEPRPLGLGKIPFPKIIHALDELDYNGYLILDTPAGDDAVASAAANLAFLQEALLSV